MPGFKYLKKENGFYIYENEAYIQTDFDTIAKLTAEKVLLKALVLSDEQIQQYGDILTELPAADVSSITATEYPAYCQARAEQTCSSFEYDSYGFRAAITLEKPQMVFFSVPWENGWTAEVNGKEMPAERVSNGLMAVRCEQGENAITFRYRTPGLREGSLVSLSGLGALLLYLLWRLTAERGSRPKLPKQKHYYDYTGTDMMFEHAVYTEHAANKQRGRPAYRRKKKEPEAQEHDS